MPLPDDLARTLDAHLASGVAPQQVLRELLSTLASRAELTAVADGTRIDLDRQRRCGLPEVIYGPGKPVPALCEIISQQTRAGQHVLATRVSAEQAEAVLQRHPRTHWNATARTLRLMQPDTPGPEHGRVVVLTAGASDRPVAEEALETLAWMNVRHECIHDVGVAGPWRLLEQLPQLSGASAVIVVAGMEGALPSVVGGWAACPVIAVPTSVGYGAAFSGLTALLGMLNSCAANVTVVNIDAGFKAGYVAGLIARGAK